MNDLMRTGFRAAMLASLLAVSVDAPTAAAESNGPFRRHGPQPAATARIIIGVRAEAGNGQARAQAAEASPDDRVRALSARSGIKLRAGPAIGPEMQVVELEQPLSGPELADTLARLASDPAVAFAEPDGRAYRHAVASDPLYPNQWYLQGNDVADVQAALNAEAAWDVSTGSAGSVIAVLDTGVRFDHPDLLQAGRGGRLLPGFDFVGPDSGGGFRTANDGDGWDANPADPGDWVSSSDVSPLGCDGTSDSSWHGTRVAGMISALTNNGTGVAGATWSGWILPVRVLGKCGGNNSDILQGMRWAAGLSVAGVPDNPYPARILNMSLGAPGTCTQGYRNVIAELATIGVLVVASVGNEDGPVELPANCAGVAGIAGLRHVGTKVGYSSFGPEVALAAPGGNCVNDPPAACLFSLDTTANSGTTFAASSTYTSQTDENIGTSFSAPQVAAIAGLMESVNGNLRAPQLIARLQEAARPFPTGVDQCQVGVPTGQFGCACTTTTCGAGMADAPGSVAAALRPIAAVALQSSVSPGQDVALDASGSAAACGRSVASYEWTGPVAISGANTAVATIVAPTSGSFTMQLTVTDDQGAQDTASITVTSSAATTAAPVDAGSTACLADITPADPGPFVDDGPVAAQSSGGGGGGGALAWPDLLLFGLGLAIRRLRRSAPRAT